MISTERIEQIPAWFIPGGTEAECVISSRVRLARNLAGHQFPARASLLEQKIIFEEVCKAAGEIELCSSCRVMNFSGMDRIEQQFHFENRIVSHDLIAKDGDRGVICDDDGRTSIMINEEDHIRMQCITAGCKPQVLWERLTAIDDLLGEKVCYAYDSRRGFLTSCPTNSGTGFRISFLMHLPGLVLTKTINQVLAGGSEMGISTRGFFGEHSEVVGNFFQLSNQATMGANEGEFLDATLEIVKKIIGYEHEARGRILKDARNEICDKIYRSYGILRYARTLAMDELLNMTSALRLGIETGLFAGLTINELNRMVLLSLPAHLELYCRRKIPEDQIGFERAELVRSLLPES